MATKVCDTILVTMDDSDELYFIVRVLTKGCLTYKYQVYQWDPEKERLTLMMLKANRIMKAILQENLVPYPQVALGDSENSSTVQTGNILWEYLHGGSHYNTLNPNVRREVYTNPRLSEIYEDGRRSNRGKKKE